MRIKTEALCSTDAKALNDRQIKYDQLHHRRRVQWLRGLARLNWLEVGLLKQSEAALQNPCYGHNSVDLSNAAYLAELDAFASQFKAVPQ